MSEYLYCGRRAHRIENAQLQVTVLVEGGHLAALTHRVTGVNPLWTPPWSTIEPSTYDAARHPEYGQGSESQLLAGIHGHNLCLDTFGAPSEAEAAAGAAVHGAAGLLPWTIESAETHLTARVRAEQLDFTRQLRLEGDKLHFEESLTNLTAEDRPIAWTQHVTLGPPFLEAGQTQFDAPIVREQDLDDGEHGHVDLTRFTAGPSASGYTAHLLDPAREQAHFLAWSPRHQLLLGYVWRSADFPWLGTWEEYRRRDAAPWNRRTETRGMEFGVSPFPESRRQMMDRARLFGVPTYRWISAKETIRVSYYAFLRAADRLPER
ncbi:MAG: hypothetical protein K2X03_06635 [Bryobacteraceae bacterium]|nr:hypothetical protein [Bryobacteraceae bacterium]